MATKGQHQDTEVLQHSTVPPNIEFLPLRRVLPNVLPNICDFENREIELRQYIDLLVNNWLNPSQYEENNRKIQLAVASQMIGSGKTFFGGNILRSAYKNRNALLPLIPAQFHEKFKEFLSAQHVYFNLKNAGTFQTEAVFAEYFFDNLLTQCFDENDKNDEEAIKIAKSECKGRHYILPIAKEFIKLIKAPLFLHFDELDCVAGEITEENLLLTPSLKSLGPLYEFWHSIHTLHNANCYIYCSGRTPQLYLLGTHPLPHRSSPSLIKHFFFDRLQHKNIVNMVATYILQGDFQLDDLLSIDSLASSIFNITAGVPRMVYYVLEYLTHKKKITKDLLSNKRSLGDLYQHIRMNGGQIELRDWQLLSEEHIELYHQFVYDAMLSIPYSPTDMLANQALFGNEKVSLLRVLWAIGLYTAKTPQYQLTGRESSESLQQSSQIQNDSTIYIIVPPIIAYDMSRAEGTELIMYQALADSLYEKEQTMTGKGDNLEKVASLSFRLRMDYKYKIHTAQTAEQLFPFLLKTNFEKLLINQGRPGTYCLPKFTFNMGDWNTNGKFVEDLVNTRYIDLKSGKTPNISQDKQVKITTWQHIMKFLQLGQYAPAEKSFSGDYYIYFSAGEQKELFMLVFQFKAGTKVYTAQDLNREIFKSIDMDWLKTQTMLKGIIFVVVGGTFNIPANARQPLNMYADEIIPQQLLLGGAETDKKSKPRPGDTYSMWPERDKLQVLHLTEKGKQRLLSPYNISALD